MAVVPRVWRGGAGSGHSCERELELSSARSAQSQSTKPQDTLQVSKQHLNAFAIAARLLEGVGLGERPGHVTGLLIDAAQDLTRRFLRATSRLEGTCSTVTRTRPVEERVIVHNLAGRGEDLERRANVDITLLGEGEVLA